MSLSAISIRKPIATAMLFAVLTLLGVGGLYVHGNIVQKK